MTMISALSGPYASIHIPGMSLALLSRSDLPSNHMNEQLLAMKAIYRGGESL